MTDIVIKCDDNWTLFSIALRKKTIFFVVEKYANTSVDVVTLLLLSASKGKVFARVQG